jgi:glycosyltransferase involved in cell wall biosynthesis
MRIVHVADSFAPDIGGIERQVETLATRQQADGHQVTVITAVNTPADLDLDVVRASPGRWLTVAFPWRDHRRIAEVLDSGDIDVVHAHFTVISPIAVYVVRAASRRGIPVAVTVHSLWWKVAIATRLSTLPFGWGRMVAAWSGVSSVAASHVARTLPRAGAISVVPNLVDTSFWHLTEAPRQTGTDGIRLILVGRLKKRKHVREFIDVLAAARQKIPAGTAVSVTIVGDGPRRADLEKQVATLGLTDWVSFVGHRRPAEIRELLHRSDLFIASSRQESFGIAALEARAAGLPVMGYRESGLSDFIADGLEGVLVADADDMAEALANLIGQPDELDRLRKTTTTFGPSVTSDQAMTAVDNLYHRARAMHRLPVPSQR